MFPLTSPVPIAAGRTSEPLDLFVPHEASQSFIRIIALWQDNRPLGGLVPTVQLRSGRGPFTAAALGPGATVPGSDSGPAATATLTPEPEDIYLVTLSDIADNAGPWAIRLTNNDSQDLRFVWFSSDLEPETRQPWLVLGAPATSTNPFVVDLWRHSNSPNQVRQQLDIRNWGTKSLAITETADSPIGDPTSGLSLQAITATLAPHDVGELVFELDPTIFDPAKATSPGAASFTFQYSMTYTLLCNDPVAAHKQLQFVLFHTPPKDTQKDTADYHPKDRNKESTDAQQKQNKDVQDDKDRKDWHDQHKRPEIAAPSPATAAGKNLADRVAGLEQTVAQLTHFIGPELRPDLSASALHGEPDQG